MYSGRLPHHTIISADNGSCWHDGKKKPWAKKKKKNTVGVVGGAPLQTMCTLVRTHSHAYPPIRLCVPTKEGCPRLTVTNGDWYCSKLQEEPIHLTRGETLFSLALSLSLSLALSLSLTFKFDYFNVVAAVISDSITYWHTQYESWWVWVLYELDHSFQNLEKNHSSPLETATYWNWFWLI